MLCDDLAAPVVAHVVRHLHLQGPFHQHPGELLEQTVFADQALGFWLHKIIYILRVWAADGFFAVGFAAGFA